MNHIDDVSKVKVCITRIDAGDVTSMLSGYFTLNGERIRFKGIAFGRIGGQNIYVKISKNAESALRNIGYDPEDILVVIERKIVEGEFEIRIEESKKRKRDYGNNE